MKLLSKLSALLPLVMTLIWVQFLPDRVPVHYDFAGNVDRWGSRWEYLLLPGVVLIMAAVFLLVAAGLKRKAAGNEKALAHAGANGRVLLTTLLITGLMFTALQAFLLARAGRAAEQGASAPALNRVTAICLGVAFVGLGNVMPKAKRNSFVGLRCGWSEYNDVTWQKSNRIGGYLLAGAGVLTVVTALLVPDAWAIPAVLILLTLAVIVSLAYASRIYRREKAKAVREGREGKS